jgi:hypothetical protein
MAAGGWLYRPWVQDLWQYHRHFVANTRWWPPFCLVVDWVAAAILVVLIAVGVDFHHSRAATLWLGPFLSGLALGRTVYLTERFNLRWSAPPVSTR